MTGESGTVDSGTPIDQRVTLPDPEMWETPDPQQARRWAEVVLGGQGTEWRLLAPGLPPRALYGQIANVEQQLVDLNGQGYQVYAVVNRVPDYRLSQLQAGRGYVSKLDVTEVRALWVDLDSVLDARERIASAPLPPSVVVRSSSRDKLHAYWLTHDLPPEEFSSYQRALVRHFGSDPSVVDLPRVMRVPGLVHRKDGRSPARTELLVAEGQRLYSAAQLRDAFAVTPEVADLGRSIRQMVAVDLAPGAVELVASALKQPDTARLANRHACLKAALNIGARAGRLEDMLRLLQGDEIRLSWTKDGTVRSHSEWLAEIDRWASAELSSGSYGLPTLRENGFTVPDLPKRLPSGDGASAGGIWTVLDLLSQPHPRWLVHELLMEDTVGIIYGPPGAGKSFLALDLGLHVAMGTERWADRRMRPGGVIYLVGEGQHSSGKRVRAWYTQNGLWPTEDRQPPLVMLMNAGPLTTARPEAALAKIAQAADYLRDRGHEPRLVIVDTVSKHMEGDENAASDAKRLVAAANLVRVEHGVTVLLVHHTGKDASKGARGSSVFKADVDTMLEVAGDERSVTLFPDKQKDAPGIERGIRFRRHVVDLGLDEEGERVTSLALSHDPTGEPIASTELTEPQLAVLSLLVERGAAPSGSHVGLGDVELWTVVKERRVYSTKSSFNSCMKRLSTGEKDRRGLHIVERERDLWRVRDWSFLAADEPVAVAAGDDDDAGAAPGWSKVVPWVADAADAS